MGAHVVVPGLTDGDDHICALADYIKGIRNVQKVELLGYHLLGREKYRVSNLPYALEGVPALSEEALVHYQKLLDERLEGVGKQ